MVRHWAIPVWCTVLLAASPAAAEAPKRSRTPEVIVSAQRIPGLSLDASRFPGNVTVITAEQLQRSGAATLPQALSSVEGVSVMDQQGFGIGADGTVNLRGVVNSARTNALVLVDGIRQNRITGDDVHWQSIPVHQIERIEIIRGGAATIYGEGALSGVINIITQRESDRLVEANSGVEVGSFGWQQYHTGVRGRRQRFRYSVDHTRRLLTGYRESSKSRNTTLATHAGVEVAPGMAVDVHVHHSEDTTGFPGLLTLAQTQQRRIQTNSFHGVNTNELDQVSVDLTAGPWDGFSGLLTMYWKRWTQFSEDSINFNAFTVTPSRGLNLRGNYAWDGEGTDNLLIGGLELFDDKATTGDRDSFAGPDSESNRFGYGLYVEDTVTLADRVSLIGGLRFDKLRYHESLTFPTFEGTLRFQGWSPKLGLTVAAIPERLQLFASYARPFKSPNVDDFSSRLGSSFNGNADLKPQQADAYEFGARLSREGAQARGAFFWTRIDEEILFDQLASTNQNFDTRRYGVELATNLTWGEHVRGSLAYTYVNARFTEGTFADSIIPGTPAHMLQTGIGVSPLEGLWMDLQWRVVSDFYRVNDLHNRLGKADNYGVLDLRCRYELPRPARAAAWWPKTLVYLNVENITHEEYSAYQSSNGTNLFTGAGEAPAPPTSFTGGVQVEF